MLMRYVYTIILAFVYLCSGAYDKFQDCRVVTNGKRPGHTKEDPNHTVNKVNYSQILNASDTETCWRQCIEYLECQMADFDQQNRTCRLYDKIGSKWRSVSHSVFTWEFCNLSRATTYKQGTPGFMFFQVNRYRQYAYPLRILTESLQQCRQMCLDLDLCGGFNHHKSDNQCQLMVLWNYVHQKLQPKTGWKSYYWTLQNPILYRIEDRSCRYRPDPCTGHWHITTKNMFDTSVMAVFETRNFSLCLASCEYSKNCKGVIYHYNESLCELKPIFVKPCVEKTAINRRDSVMVEWKCCNDTFQRPPLLSTPTKTCHVIQQPDYVTLVPFQCNRLPPPDLLETCSTNSKVFSTPCFLRQGLFSTGSTWNKYLKVFNGYRTFWIRNATANNFQPSEYIIPCQLYNATIPTNPKIALTTRYDWFSYPRQENYSQFTEPPSYVIVGTLDHSNCLCFEWLHCVEILRDKQFSKSLTANFYIGANGFVFENIGWRNQSNIENEVYSTRSLYIDFMGNFKTNSPSLTSMMTFRNLVAYGVWEGYMKGNYTLLTMNDIDGTKNLNYPSLYNIIRTLPHYNGSTRPDCKQISNLTLLLNGVSSIVLLLVVGALSNILFRVIHSSGCGLLRKSSIENRLSRIEFNDFNNLSIRDKILSSHLKNYIADNDISIKIDGTTFFFVTEILGSDKCLCCKRTVEETLRLFRRRKKPVKLECLKAVSKFCGKSTVQLTFKTESILSKTVVVFLHFREANMIFNLQHISSTIIAGRCVCLNYLIYKLDTETKNSKFKIM